MRQVERQNHGQSPGQHHGHAYGRVQAHGIHPVQHPHPQHRTAARSDYTLGHGGRQFRLGPVTFWIVVGATVIMAGWSLATGTYFAFHDDVLTRLMARQKDQQFAYELLAEEKVLIVQGTGFNWMNPDHFRLVFLPNSDDLRDAIGRIARFLDGYRKRHA